MAARSVAEANRIAVPQSLAEADALVRRIGEAQREIQRIETEANTEVEKRKGEAVAKTQPLQGEIDQLVAALFTFAESHRAGITKQGKTKTVKVPSGQFGWRLLPPSLVLRRPVEEIVAALKLLKLRRFIHRQVVETVDKKVLSRRPDVVDRLDGVELGQAEVFEVKPAALGVTIGKTIDQLKTPASGC